MEKQQKSRTWRELILRELITVTFGNASSSYLVIRSFHEIANEIRVYSPQTIITTSLQRRGFTLSKWLSKNGWT